MVNVNTQLATMDQKMIFSVLNADSNCADKALYDEENNRFVSTTACKDPRAPLPRFFNINVQNNFGGGRRRGGGFSRGGGGFGRRRNNFASNVGGFVGGFVGGLLFGKK